MGKTSRHDVNFGTLIRWFHAESAQSDDNWKQNIGTDQWSPNKAYPHQPNFTAMFVFLGQSGR